MKFNILSLPFLFISAVAAFPGSNVDAGLIKRQDANAATDQLLFGMSLDEFISRRNAHNPGNLDWSSDGCSDSPDNPFGFPFLPACERHDFGYRNYKNQGRFSSDNKLRIDDNFRNEYVFMFICAEPRIATPKF